MFIFGYCRCYNTSCLVENYTVLSQFLICLQGLVYTKTDDIHRLAFNALFKKTPDK